MKQKESFNETTAKTALNIIFNLSADAQAHAAFPSCITGFFFIAFKLPPPYKS